ncbi:MAG: hypothetical protein AB7I36_19805 [Rhodospirillaceae bacterium]
MATDTTYPDRDWYLAQSHDRGVASRCPFAHVRRCPHYFYSRSLLGEHGSTRIPPDEDARLMEKWKQSDAVPMTAEDQPSIVNSGERTSFFKFCPETLGDRFGLFVSDLSPHADEIDQAAAHRSLELRGIKRSPYFTWAVCEPLHYLNCATHALLSHGPQVTPPAPSSDTTQEPWWKRNLVLTWIGIVLAAISTVGGMIVLF